MADDAQPPGPPEDPGAWIRRLRAHYWGAGGDGEGDRMRKAFEWPHFTFRLTQDQWKQIAEDPDLSEH